MRVCFVILSAFTLTYSIRLYFLLWCALSTIHTILGQDVLNRFPYPWTVTLFKLGVASCCGISAWLLHIRPVPKISLKGNYNVVTVAFFNSLGLVLTNLSLQHGKQR